LVHEGFDGVRTFSGKFNNHVEQIVYPVGVVTSTTDERLGAPCSNKLKCIRISGTAPNELVIAGTADEKVVAEPANQVVIVAGAEDQVVSAAAGDCVVVPILTGDEIIDRGGGEVDGARATAWISPADGIIADQLIAVEE